MGLKNLNIAITIGKFQVLPEYNEIGGFIKIQKYYQIQYIKRYLKKIIFPKRDTFQNNECYTLK